MKRKLKFLGMLVFVAASIALLGGLVMWLWNAVMPHLFDGARTIDYLHAIGLLALCRILFGGFRGHGRWHDHRRHGMHARWEAMTEEERAAFSRKGPWRWCKGHGSHDLPKRNDDQ